MKISYEAVEKYLHKFAHIVVISSTAVVLSYTNNFMIICIILLISHKVLLFIAKKCIEPSVETEVEEQDVNGR